MILKEEIVLGIYSWLHMTPVSMLVRNITSDQGGDYAIVRFTVDSRGGQMGPKAQGQLLCSFGFNVKGEPAEFGKNRTLRFSGHP